MLPQLHTPSPIFMPPPSWEGGQHWPLLTVCSSARLAAGLPLPPSCLPAGRAFCPQKTRSLWGLCQASSRCSGSRAPPWKHPGHGLGEPQVGGALIQAQPAPQAFRDGEEVQVHRARGSSRGGVEKGMDARKRGWGGERGWPDSCVLGFRSGLRRVAQSIRGGS